ncbi:D-alanyl-D-alanine carboxypeptidase [Gracilibacillus boraciitolerans JCM 21714]|uniref:D-alanyl-D-alanine carboxypeptidase n=1 Tax=Gracilibacillus boraciitolerans JCM 21714 TaxID=1298598 RepID=W4VQD6_9BACI|nr:serine hydrolase [Gracilibacillus boraciitolerans]GAE95427.1 D-alanyl-D-alanine carboxypeptidase [Gracilibacillus boraciitolerans JCM 21714]
MEIYIWIIIIIFLILTIFWALAKIIKSIDDKKNEHDVLMFIKNNPEKASICAIYNDTPPLLDYQADMKMPLASTMKIVIAIEFAKQADIKAIEIQELVPLKELDKYFIENTDGGGSHMDWIDYLKENDQLNNGQVTLLQVAKGMIQFSSNANTEFLMNKLGLDRVNHLLKSLSLYEHDPLFPISTANLICAYLQSENGTTQKESIKTIKEMTNEEYRKKARHINELLRNDNEKKLIDRLNIKDNYNIQLQVVSSEKQPKSTTREYANLMQNIRNRAILTSNGHEILHGILNITPNKDSSIIDLGLKGGSTISVLTTAFYSKDKEGNTIDMAIFIHDPSRMDLIWIEKKLDLFIGKLATDKNFKEEVIRTLKSK